MALVLLALSTAISILVAWEIARKFITRQSNKRKSDERDKDATLRP